MSGLLLDKVLNIFLHNPTYERDGFNMLGRIIEKYKLRGTDALFESASTLYTIKQTQDNSISDYMSRSRRLFSGLHSLTFNTMANLVIIVNSNGSRFSDLTNRFLSRDPKVVKAYVNRLEMLLEAIEYRSHVFDGLLTTKTSALRRSALKSETTPVPQPKSDRPKTTAPPEGA